MPLICNRCGRPVGDHLSKEIRKLCAGSVPSNPTQMRKTANTVISRLKTHTPSRRHNPTRPHNPRLTH